LCDEGAASFKRKEKTKKSPKVNIRVFILFYSFHSY